MASFLFWNLNQKALQARVARLAQQLQVDVVMLAECNLPPAEVLHALNESGTNSYCFPFSQAEKICIFTRFSPSSMTAVFDDPARRLTVRRLRVGNHPDVLLAVVHFHSKVNWSEHDQLGEATYLARDLRRLEDENGHQRTILVGDLNMHPFDKAVVSAHGLHGVMTRQLAARGQRTVARRDYPFFYNPMWGCFGDRTAGPAGSHYYPGSAPVTYYWNVFDQVLLRPSLMDRLHELRILDNDGTAPLLQPSGLPDTDAGSDHLPLFFELNL
jgi:endonuclease/exonuclease/phosphatase family metal-dependent hydrolase